MLSIKCFPEVFISELAIEPENQVTQCDPEQGSANDIKGIVNAQVYSAVRDNGGPDENEPAIIAVFKEFT